MWRCPTCGRSFRRTGQVHSCRVVPVEDHFRRKPDARVLFDQLLAAVEDDLGPCEVVSLPCCIHLAKGVDFVAVLPRQGRLEVRFVLRDELVHRRVARSTQISAGSVKHSVEVVSADDIDDELLGWIRRAQDVSATAEAT